MIVIFNYLAHLAVYFLLAFIIYLPIRLIYIKRKKLKPVILHEIILVLFVCWTVGILSQTIFPTVYIDTYQGLEITMIFPSVNTLTITSDGFNYQGANEIVRKLNLIPLKTVFEYLFPNSATGAFSETALQTFSTTNLLGNLLLFVPFGFLLPFLNKRTAKFKNTLLVSAAFIFLIELVQYLIGRIADIDDFIVNILGVCAGYLAYYILTKIIERLKVRLA